MALGGFLGSAINRTLEAVIPKGSRGKILGEALGVGGTLGQSISESISGIEEPIIQQLQAEPTRSTTGPLSTVSTSPINLRIVTGKPIH